MDASNLSTIKETIREIRSTTDATEEEALFILRMMIEGKPHESALELFRTFKGDLAECESRFLAGNNLFLFEAVRRCNQYRGFPVPLWVREGLQVGYDRYRNFQASTFSSAFDIHRESHFRMESNRERNEIGYQVYHRVKELNTAGQPIDDALFEDVGKEFGMSISKAKKIYYEGKAAFRKIADSLSD